MTWNPGRPAGLCLPLVPRGPGMWTPLRGHGVLLADGRGLESTGPCGVYKVGGTLRRERGPGPRLAGLVGAGARAPVCCAWCSQVQQMQVWLFTPGLRWRLLLLPPFFWRSFLLGLRSDPPGPPDHHQQSPWSCP